MKITRKQFKKIIKDQLLNEMLPDGVIPLTPASPAVGPTKGKRKVTVSLTKGAQERQKLKKAAEAKAKAEALAAKAKKEAMKKAKALAAKAAEEAKDAEINKAVQQQLAQSKQPVPGSGPQKKDIDIDNMNPMDVYDSRQWWFDKIEKYKKELFSIKMNGLRKNTINNINWDKVNTISKWALEFIPSMENISDKHKDEKFMGQELNIYYIGAKSLFMTGLKERKTKYIDLAWEYARYVWINPVTPKRNEFYADIIATFLTLSKNDSNDLRNIEYQETTHQHETNYNEWTDILISKFKNTKAFNRFFRKAKAPFKDSEETLRLRSKTRPKRTEHSYWTDALGNKHRIQGKVDPKTGKPKVHGITYDSQDAWIFEPFYGFDVWKMWFQEHTALVNKIKESFKTYKKTEDSTHLDHAMQDARSGLKAYKELERWTYKYEQHMALQQQTEATRFLNNLILGYSKPKIIPLIELYGKNLPNSAPQTSTKTYSKVKTTNTDAVQEEAVKKQLRLPRSTPIAIDENYDELRYLQIMQYNVYIGLIYSEKEHWENAIKYLTPNKSGWEFEYNGIKETGTSAFDNVEKLRMNRLDYSQQSQKSEKEEKQNPSKPGVNPKPPDPQQQSKKSTYKADKTWNNYFEKTLKNRSLTDAENVVNIGNRWTELVETGKIPGYTKSFKSWVKWYNRQRAGGKHLNVKAVLKLYDQIQDGTYKQKQLARKPKRKRVFKPRNPNYYKNLGKTRTWREKRKKLRRKMRRRRKRRE
jgi:hypothetical protein